MPKHDSIKHAAIAGAANAENVALSILQGLPSESLDASKLDAFASARAEKEAAESRSENEFVDSWQMVGGDHATFTTKGRVVFEVTKVIEYDETTGEMIREESYRDRPYYLIASKASADAFDLINHLKAE